MLVDEQPESIQQQFVEPMLKLPLRYRCDDAKCCRQSLFVNKIFDEDDEVIELPKKAIVPL